MCVLSAPTGKTLVEDIWGDTGVTMVKTKVSNSR